MLKPVDLAVLVFLASQDEKHWTQAAVGDALGLSQSSVNRALSQLEASGLIFGWELRASSLYDLLVHGVRYVYPADFGAPCRGIVTAHSAPPLLGLVGGDHVLVWPSEDGDAFGVALSPLHPAVPGACLRWPGFYKHMVLVDALRVGRVRERILAQEMLAESLGLDP